MSHSPPQHSKSAEHESPSCVQNDDGPHVEPLQYCEQQSPFAVHALPSVLHAALSAAHVPLVHEPPQHSPSCVHEPPSDVHWFAEHEPPMQLTVQQSVFAAHAWPADAHVVVFTVHAPFESHMPEQHVAPVVHAVPNTPHAGPDGPPASSPPPVVAPLCLLHAMSATERNSQAIVFIEMLLAGGRAGT
jgi:hypothetical protein